MTKDELIKELGNLAIRFSEGWHEGIKIDASDIMLFNQIAEALAQPEKEPVAWRYKILDYFGRPVWTLKTPKTDIRVFESQPLYTTPPQRTWVGLTDDERIDLMYESGGNEIVAIQITEAKLKEKNT